MRAAKSTKENRLRQISSARIRVIRGPFFIRVTRVIRGCSFWLRRWPRQDLCTTAIRENLLAPRKYSFVYGGPRQALCVSQNRMMAERHAPSLIARHQKKLGTEPVGNIRLWAARFSGGQSPVLPIERQSECRSRTADHDRRRNRLHGHRLASHAVGRAGSVRREKLSSRVRHPISV